VLRNMLQLYVAETTMRPETFCTASFAERPRPFKRGTNTESD
ncbi:hypothetical protein SeLEV6574_g08169, partial [Synchytrium endobioticum]